MDWPLELQRVKPPASLPVAPEPGRSIQISWYRVEHRAVGGACRFLIRNIAGDAIGASATWGGILRIFGWLPPFVHHAYPALYATTYTGRLAKREAEPETRRLTPPEVLAARVQRHGLFVANASTALAIAVDLADADRQRAILRRMTGIRSLRILWGDTRDPLTQRQAALLQHVTPCDRKPNTSSLSPKPNPKPPEGSRSHRSPNAATTATHGESPASVSAAS